MNRKFEGTGLGLTISAKLVKMMNGNINVESDGKNGTTFTISFLKVENHKNHQDKKNQF